MMGGPRPNMPINPMMGNMMRGPPQGGPMGMGGPPRPMGNMMPPPGGMRPNFGMAGPFMGGPGNNMARGPRPF